MGWPFLKHWPRVQTSAWLKEEGSALESLACAAGARLATPLASRYQVLVRSQIISIGKSFAAEMGCSSSMLYESNLLEFIFQGNLHSNKRVVVQFIAIGEEEGEKDA